MLHCYRAERADLLIDALAEVLAVPPTDPLMPDVVAVHSRGIERWIAQELSHRLGTGARGGDGVCANVAFPFPGRLISTALALATGIEPEQDRWRPERLVWPVLEVLDTRLDEPWLGPLREHLVGGDGADARARRFSAARHIAGLFDRYGVHRPRMVRDWLNDKSVNAEGATLPAGAAWQAELWRAVRAHVAQSSPPERSVDALDALAALPFSPELPERLCLFGLTALPASYAEVLHALARRRQLHLLLLHPSDRLWARIHAQVGPSPGARPGRLPLRSEDASRQTPSNPLLASWGRDARELQLVVVPVLDRASEHRALPAGEPSSLLARIQADVRADLPPGEDGRAELASEDRTLQIHACHGRTRQVEVLRDALLHLLADDPTLEPRDIVVMCPDIEQFAPLVHAAFERRAGATATASGPASDDSSDLPDLRIRLADRALRQTNPVLRITAELLELADSRVTASRVLDLAARGPVRRRLRFDDEALDRMQTWVAQAAIRWGLDGEHRGRFDLRGVTANTWRAGLDRLLLGVAMADEQMRSFHGVVPVDNVEGVELDLAGRLAELVERLGAAFAAFDEPQDIAAWRATITTAVESLTATPESERWQHLQLDRILDDLVAAAGTSKGSSGTLLTLADVRSLLEPLLAGHPTRANHRTGDLTVCTLVPMRAVPHRVVCLLGLDDGDFPRRALPDGDDLTELQPRVGDRDRRSEDRQLLLDALLSATQTLLITYTGRDERTNEPRPPAVPVSELLDVIDRTAQCPDGGAASSAVVIPHPLQPHDPQNFQPGRLVAGRPFGFDPVAREGAVALAEGASTPPAFVSEPLPPPNERADAALSDLISFLQHPVKAFLRQRLQVVLGGRADEPSDAIPVELDALERWQLGDELLGLRREGRDTRRWVDHTRARGLLPPGALADTAIERLRGEVDAVLATADEHIEHHEQADAEGRQTPPEVAVELGEGRLLTGSVPEIRGEVVLQITYSRVKAKQRLASWANLLAITAAHPERAWSAVLVGRGRATGTATCFRIAPLGPTPEERKRAALRQLGRLVDLHDRGLCEPLPLYCATSAAWSAARFDPEAAPTDAAAKASAAWTTGWRFPCEDRDPEHVLVLGGVVEFERLLDEPAMGEELAWQTGEPSRFGALAQRLWQPLLEREEELRP